jgi:hypothetical protein
MMASDESTVMQAAIMEVSKLTKANKVNRRVIQALCVTLVLVLITCGVLSYIAVDQHSADLQLRNNNASLRQESITSCESGNSYRSGNQELWEDFIGLLINKKTPAATVKIADGFLARVKTVDALHDCTALYASAASDP